MRYEILRKVLKDEPFEPNGPSDTAWFEWATTHQPLASPSIYTPTGRHLNHFCVGSDPEFSFALEGDRIPAVATGMKVGLAAGCDQNERLVELRPWPSVSVVTHVAGILTALRWMYRVYAHNIQPYSWRAGAFFAGDGMGGHVHFGRKRPTRDDEVQALDGLARVFKHSGLFPIAEWDRRIRGDKLGQMYGKPGDYRIQRHGYEYRSLPSWLQSPTVAFIVVTASKLAVLDPSITATWNKRKLVGQNDAANLLRGLAKLYRYRDDDAYILYHVLTRDGLTPFILDHARDFSGAWGINRRDKPPRDEHDYILPACIEPNELEVTEMENHLLHGTGLHNNLEYHPNFKFALPKGYIWVPAQVQPGRHSGYGDLIHNLVYTAEAPVYFQYSNNNGFEISGFAAERITAHEERMLKEYHHCRVRREKVGADKLTGLTVPKDLCQTATIGRFRDTLLRSGLFPLWTVDSVEPGSFAKWLATRPVPKDKTWRNV